MHKTSILWLTAGVVLGAATALVGVGVRHSATSGLTAQEAETVSEIQALLGDPAPGATDWIAGTPAPLGGLDLTSGSAFPPIAENNSDTSERLHFPILIEEDVSATSIPATPPQPWTPPPSVASDALPYTGNHSVILEKIGKIKLPHGVCEQLMNPRLLFVTAGADGCIEVYPPVALDRDPAGRKLNEEDARRQRRLWYSRMTALRVDADGGCVLPKSFVQAADLDGYLTIIGVGDHFEIWDAQRWQDYVEGKDAEEVAAPVEPECWKRCDSPVLVEYVVEEIGAVQPYRVRFWE